MASINVIYNEDAKTSSLVIMTGTTEITRITWNENAKTMTFAVKTTAHTRPKAEFISNVSRILKWYQDLGDLFPGKQHQYDSTLCDISIKKDATKLKYTGSIGALIPNFEYKYSTADITIGTRATDQVISWSAWQLYVHMLDYFAQLVSVS